MNTTIAMRRREQRFHIKVAISKKIFVDRKWCGLHLIESILRRHHITSVTPDESRCVLSTKDTEISQFQQKRSAFWRSTLSEKFRRLRLRPNDRGRLFKLQ